MVEYPPKTVEFPLSLWTPKVCHCEGHGVARGNLRELIHNSLEIPIILSNEIASSCLTALLAMTKEGGTPRNDGEREELLAMTKGRSRYFFQRQKKKGYYGNPYRGPKLCAKSKECAREDSNLRSTAPEAVALSY